MQTQPTEPGVNPNINTVVKFNVKMPVDPLYCPTLSVGVYDYLFLGMSQPLIGTFTINLGDHFHQHVSKNVKYKRSVMAAFEEVKRIRPAEPALAIDEANPRQVKLQAKKEYELTPIKPSVKMPQNAAGVAKLNLDQMSKPLSVRKARKGLFVRKPNY